MAEYIPNAFATLREAFVAACPQLLGTGVWESEHADFIPWADFDIPFGVILIEEMRSADWGATMDVYQVPVKMYYIGQVDGPMGSIRTQLETLRDTINTWGQGGVSGRRLQVVEKTTLISWSGDLEPNRILTAKGASQRVGLLQMDFLFGGGMPVATRPS